MKVVLMGHSNAGYYCLKELIRQNANIVAVVTVYENPNKKRWYKSVKELAIKNNLKVFTPEKANDTGFINAVNELKPDIIFSVYYDQIIPKEILDSSSFGGINFHGALLPQYRGCFTAAWPIINNEKESGVTAHYMEVETDTGSIVGVEKVKIDFDDRGREVYDNVTKATVKLFKRLYKELNEKNGKLSSIPQDHSKANYYGRKVPFDGIINWQKTALEIYNFIRALYFPPFLPAMSFYKNKKLYIAKSLPHGNFEYKKGFGQIKDMNSDGFYVKTKEGDLLVKEVLFDDKELTGKEFMEKYDIKKGEFLG